MNSNLNKFGHVGWGVRCGGGLYSEIETEQFKSSPYGLVPSSKGGMGGRKLRVIGALYSGDRSRNPTVDRLCTDRLD